MFVFIEFVHQLLSVNDNWMASGHDPRQFRKLNNQYSHMFGYAHGNQDKRLKYNKRRFNYLLHKHYQLYEFNSDTIDSFIIPHAHNFFVEPLYMTAKLLFPDDTIVLVSNYVSRCLNEKLTTHRCFVYNATKMQLFDIHSYYEFTRNSNQLFSHNTLMQKLFHPKIHKYAMYARIHDPLMFTTKR